MKQFQRDILNLIKSSVTGEETWVSSDFSWNTLYQFARKHQLFSMLYYGALNSKIDIPESLTDIVSKCAVIDHYQQDAVKTIFSAFEENKIDFLPVKGILLKSLYPKTDMRFMSDADILIKTEQYEKIKAVMTDLGFDQTIESDHEYVFKKGNALYIELHKHLIPSYNKDYYDYYGTGWKLAHKTKTTRFELTTEDHFIYLLTHYAKHYRDAGIGIKYLVDLYLVLSKQNPDVTYIEQELKKLRLYDFYKNTLNMLSVWFEGSSSTELTDFMTDRIFESGAYGTKQTSVISQALKDSKSVSQKNVRKMQFFKLIFLPFKSMKVKYPFLNKLPFLLPVMWIIRIFDTLLFKRSSIKNQKDRLTLITPENISKYQQELNYVGLDFNFKE